MIPFFYYSGNLEYAFFFFFSSRRRHTRLQGDWSSDVCSSDLGWPARHLARRPAILASESAHWRVATAELEIREMLRAAWLRPPLKPSFAERLWAVSSRVIRKDDRSHYTLAGPAVPDRRSCRPRPCDCAQRAPSARQGFPAPLGECPVAVLWVRRSETNRPSKSLEDTRGEVARKGLTHRRMANDSPKIQWSCQRVNEQVGVGVPGQFSSRDGLLDQVYIHGSSRQIETFEEESPKRGICLHITDQADGDGCVLRMKPRRAADHTLMQPFERRSLKRWRQHRLHPRQKCVEHDRLLALPPTIQSGRAHACLLGQFLCRY